MKIFNTILLCTAFALSSSYAHGLEVVNTQPGTLKTSVGSQAASTTSLTVKGVINAADFEFICHEMPALISLNLSETTIASYSGDKLLNGRFSSNSLAVPECALLGSGVTSLVLPATITEIGQGAFAGTKITSVAIPASVTKIGESAFTECSQLKSVTIPASVTTIGQSAFANCTALETATITGAVTEIPTRAFAGCSALKTVVLPSSATSIGEEAFASTALQSLTLADCTALASIGKWAFAGCNKLKSVVLPSPAPEMGEGAFYYNTVLAADVTALQGANTEIADYLYTGNEAMTINNFDTTSVSTIGNYALQGLSGVSQLNLPASLESLGDHAMGYMTGLSVINAEKLAAVPAVGEDVWDGVAQNDVTLNVTVAMKDAFSNADQWQDFDIKTIWTALDETEMDGSATNNGVTGKFAGSELIVSSLNANIVGVQLYDIAGRMYQLAAKAPSTLMTLDASAVENGVYVVCVMLADNTSVALKLKK